MKAKVYFSREITPEKVVALYRAVGRELPGKVAVKLHSGEQGNQNFLGPDFWRPMIETVHGTVVECNTAYEGERNTTEKHRRTMIKHGWSTNFDVEKLLEEIFIRQEDLMDASIFHIRQPRKSMRRSTKDTASLFITFREQKVIP